MWPDGSELEPEEIDGRAVENVRHQARPRRLRVAFVEDVSKQSAGWTQSFPPTRKSESRRPAGS